MVELMTPFTTEAIARPAIGSDSVVSLKNLPFTVKTQLRGRSEESAFADYFIVSTSLALPIQPNTGSRGKERSAFWLGPDEWLVREELSELPASSSTVALGNRTSCFESSGDFHRSVVDVSDYYTILELAGPEVFSVLEKSCPLDVSQTVRDESSCAQTKIGNAAVLITRSDEDLPKLQLQVRWSYAEYLWDYLAEGMIEFGQVETVGNLD